MKFVYVERIDSDFSHFFGLSNRQNCFSVGSYFPIFLAVRAAADGKMFSCFRNSKSVEVIALYLIVRVSLATNFQGEMYSDTNLFIDTKARLALSTFLSRVSAIRKKGSSFRVQSPEEHRLSLRGGCSLVPTAPLPPRSFFEGLYGPLWKDATLEKPEDELYKILRAGVPADGPPYEALNHHTDTLDRSSQRFIRGVYLPPSITERSLDELNYQDRAKIEVLRSAKLLQIQQQGLVRQRRRRQKQDNVLWRVKTALLTPASLLKHCVAAILRCAGLLPPPPQRRLKYIIDVLVDPPPPPAHDLPVSGPLGLLLLEKNGGKETVARYRRGRWGNIWAGMTGWLRPCFGMNVLVGAHQ